MHENGSGLVLRYAVALFTEAVKQTSVKQTNGPRLVLTISALRHGLSPPTEVELEGVLNEVAGIEKIDLTSMKRMPNLEVLWLNDNLLTKLQGLDFNFRLKHLYLHNKALAQQHEA